MRDDWWDDDGYEHCDHEDYDADILTGFATCGLCGHKWMQTEAEIQRERAAQQAWDRQCEEWERNPPPPLPQPAPTGDDIPF